VDSARCHVMLSWTVAYTARPVLSSLQTSRRRRGHAAALTSRDPQSHKASVTRTIYFCLSFGHRRPAQNLFPPMTLNFDLWPLHSSLI